MRFDGTLKIWNADRGLGFVVADQGGEEIPIHVSAFPRDGCVPAVDEALSFEIDAGRDGKKCAVRVQRIRAAPPVPIRSRSYQSDYSARTERRRYSDDSHKSGFGSSVIGLVIVAALGWYGYTQYANRVAQIQGAPQTTIASPLPAPAPTPAGFKCDGRQHCSQMTSCNEAKLFLKNCPGVQMDGDGDGVPCEQQWCTANPGN